VTPLAQHVPIGPGPLAPPEVTSEAGKIYLMFYGVLGVAFLLLVIWYAILLWWPKKERDE